MVFPSILRRLFAAAYLCQFLSIYTVYAVNSHLSWTPDGPQRPSGSGVTLDGRKAGVDDGDWFTITDDNWTLFDYGTKVGYRLANDYSNVVVLQSETWDDALNVTFYGNPSDSPHMHNFVSVGGVEFTDSLNPNATSGDIWTSTAAYTVLPVTIAFATDDFRCTDTKTITISTLDANGVSNTFTGIDKVSGSVGSALPIQLNLTYAENPGYNVAVTYNPTDSIRYLLGDGPVQPYVPNALLTSYFFLCN